jgi:hypothetical protein
VSCIYTGARVFFQDYDFIVPADLYEVGDTIIIRWNPQGKEYTNVTNESSSTHDVWIVHGWHREDIGVTVIKKEYIRGQLYR